MVIQRKRLDVASELIEVESDPTDTVDIGGFSAAINSLTAITAQFSDTSIMQANTGLRIGLTKMSVVAAAAAARSRSVESSVDMSNTANAIDDNPSTFATNTFDAIPAEIIIDFGVIATAIANADVESTSVNFTDWILSTSTDDIIYTQQDTESTNGSSGTVTMSSGSVSYRYIKLEMAPPSLAQGRISNIYESNIVETSNINIRSSATQNGTDGTILQSEVITANTTTSILTDLLLTGNGQFVTLEIVSQSSVFNISLSDIVSITEV